MSWCSKCNTACSYPIGMKGYCIDCYIKDKFNPAIFYSFLLSIFIILGGLFFALGHQNIGLIVILLSVIYGFLKVLPYMWKDNAEKTFKQLQEFKRLFENERKQYAEYREFKKKEIEELGERIVKIKQQIKGDIDGI